MLSICALHNEVGYLYWKISDFVEEIKSNLEESKLHINTVDGWFKKLEEERLHYISRTEETNEKVYDQLDLAIAVYIKQKRNDKWTLSSIFNHLSDQFELREFPVDSKETTSVSEVLDVSELKSQLVSELMRSMEEVAVAQIVEIKNHYEGLLKQLPKPKSLAEEKEERFQEMVARRRVEVQLEEEASDLWTKQPDSERLRKVGWFRQEEDLVKRDRFVKNYVNRYFDDRLRKELGI